MFAYRTPGVYFEQTDLRPSVIEPVRTDIAGFVGIAGQGPIHRPVKVESWIQFTSVFGAYIPQGYLAFAVAGFFGNGGQTCWVVRVADPADVRWAMLDVELYKAEHKTGRQGSSLPELRLVASSPGSWANQLKVSIVPFTTGSKGSPILFSLTLDLPGVDREVYSACSYNPQDPENRGNEPNHVLTLLANSRFVRAYSVQQSRQAIPVLDAFHIGGNSARLSGGQDGLRALQPEHLAGRGTLPVSPVPGGRYDGGRYDNANWPAFGGLMIPQLADQPWGLQTLENVDEVGIVAIPDIMPRPRTRLRPKVPRLRCDVLTKPTEAEPATLNEDELEMPPQFTEGEVADLQGQLIRHCALLKDRVAILDAPSAPNAPFTFDTASTGSGIPGLTPAEVVDWRQKQLNFSEEFVRYAALYYPWMRVMAPQGFAELTHDVPPSGHVAGIYARTDRLTGVHKAPFNEVVEGVIDVVTRVDDIDHGELNERNVNVIRAYNGRGVRVAGARTLSRAVEWRYVNVRRLLSMIEESVDQSIQWTVFEPNNPTLWREVDRQVRSFLDNLWRRGMLDGATAANAYLVNCDETTNIPQELDAGRLTCLIGVQPPWPAEFVIVRIGKSESGRQITETVERMA